MSVLVEAFTLVLQHGTVERAYPGGIRGFRLDFPDSFAADEHLVRMGSMDPRDVRVTVDRLQELGVRYATRTEYLEMAVVLQNIGPTAACRWLTFTKRDDTSLCWLEAEPEGELATPPGWSPARSAEWDRRTAGDPSRWVPVEFAGPEDGQPEEDPPFGERGGVGAPFEDGAALRALLARAKALDASYVERGHTFGLADLYRRAAGLNPKDAELTLIAGHMLDREDRTEEGLAYVERALELDPNHAGALTQKGCVLGRTGHPREALELLRRAVEADPSNSSAWSNKAREERYAKLTDDAIASYERFLELARNKSVHPVLIEEAQEFIEKWSKRDASDRP
jgi:tetratricopeptide (TPR) repeat protein